MCYIIGRYLSQGVFETSNQKGIEFDPFSWRRFHREQDCPCVNMLEAPFKSIQQTTGSMRRQISLKCVIWPPTSHHWKKICIEETKKDSRSGYYWKKYFHKNEEELYGAHDKKLSFPFYHYYLIFPYASILFIWPGLAELCPKISSDVCLKDSRYSIKD